MTDPRLEPDVIIAGPFWQEPVRVLRTRLQGDSVQIEAVGIVASQYYNLVIPLDQINELVKEVVGGSHSFDASPKLFRLGVEALRTELAHAFDPQFAVSVSQVDPLPHQLIAVYKHMLVLPRIRFLLADDPGAGKTIMAGLLMRELIQRGDVKRVLVLCPKALTDQWRREMWDRFRERFQLVTGETVANNFGQNTWVENDKVVASIDLAIQDHVIPGIHQSNWDLIIFDEAHKLSAYRYGAAGRIDKTKRYLLAEKLATQTKHLLLMTATPHRGNKESFRLLMSLLDDKVFASQAGTENALKGQNSPYFLRRMKEVMRDFDGRPLFLPRHVDTVAYQLNPHEQELYDAVTKYVSEGLAVAEESSNRNVTLALIILQRRMASSLFALTRSLERRRDRLSEELEVSGRSSSAGRASPGSTLVDYDPDEDEPQDLTVRDEETLSGASTARTAAELRKEVALLGELIELARSTQAKGLETKVTEFRNVIESQIISDRNEKILVFTEHRDTLTYLTRLLEQWGHSVCNIHGGMHLADRIAAERDFRGQTQFMVATEAAGEGINLQFCKVMINWDLPWNPNRLEQRMGRIHRYGQTDEVQVYNLVANTTREGSVLVTLMEKLERMRDQLGNDQVYDVVSGILDAGQVQLDTLMRQAILNRRSMEDILEDLEFVDSSASVNNVKEILGTALATPNLDLGMVLADDRDSKERRLTPEFVERYFMDGFRFLGGRINPASDSAWQLEFVPADIRQEIRAYNADDFGTPSRLVTFRKDRLRREPPAEFLGPDHPLFDAVQWRILEQGRPILAHGSAFIDKEAREPYLVWLLQAGVVNGANEVVHGRLLALRQTGDTFEAVEPGILLDLPPADVAPQAPESLKALCDGDTAVARASALYSSQYLAEVSAEQRRQAEIVEGALQQSVNDNLTELQERLERQLEEEASGRDMRLAIRTTNDQIDSLTNEFRRRREDLQRRKVTSIQTPRVMGVAAVIPGPVPRVMEQGRSGGDNTNVELAAMKVAMDHEVLYGRTPVDVSKRGVGYDVRSEGPDGEVRYIEVKGHGATGDVVLYYTEWQMAHRMRKEFFIYEVNHALTEPELRIVRDPVGQGIEATERVVEYHVSAYDIERYAARPNDQEVYGRMRGDFDFPCAICGSDLLDELDWPPEMIAGYPNLICPNCNEKAVTADGMLANLSFPGIETTPVYVDGKQCWRRHGYPGAPMYDPFNSQSLEEFHRKVFSLSYEDEDLDEEVDEE